MDTTSKIIQQFSEAKHYIDNLQMGDDKEYTISIAGFNLSTIVDPKFDTYIRYLM